MNQNGQIRYTCVSSFPYSPFASRSLAVSQPNLIPHWQHIPRFSAVVAGPSRSSPSGRRLWYGFLVRSHSTLAAFPAILSRDSVPLWQVRLAAALPAGVSGTDSSSGPFPHWQHIPRFSAVAAGPSRSSPSGRRLWYGFLVRSHSTLAAFPAIRCAIRCCYGRKDMGRISKNFSEKQLPNNEFCYFTAL